MPSAGLTAHAAERPDAPRPRARVTADLCVAVLERDALPGEFDHTFRRSLVQRSAVLRSPAALAGVRVPVLRAEAQARTRRAPGPDPLAVGS